MKNLILIFVCFVLFSCLKNEYHCYQCIQTKIEQYQRTWTCGTVDTITVVDTLYNKTKCDTDYYIMIWERNYTHPCGEIVMKCWLKE